MRKLFKRSTKAFQRRKLYRELCIKLHWSSIILLCEDENRNKCSQKQNHCAFAMSRIETSLILNSRSWNFYDVIFMKVLMQMNTVCSQKRKIQFKCLKLASKIDEIFEMMFALWKSTTTIFSLNVDNVEM